MNQEHLDDLITFLRFASISTDSRHDADITACAQWLQQKLQDAGLQAQVHPTGGHPVVLARNAHQPGRPTLLIYGHYDVQPADPLELWSSPPFQPRVENGRIHARGATDNKGQILAHILGVQETIRAKGELPVNLTFLIEGEEEIGSPHLGAFLQEQKEFCRCDVIAVSDSGMVAEEIPTFTYGLRGIATMEVRITGPSSDLHSGIYGGAVANPATALARLLATLHDADGKVAVEGFYDRVQEVEAWERDLWKKLPLQDKELLQITGSPATTGERLFTALERTWVRPTAEINGIGGGYQGQGSKTIIPSEAFAKLSFRLVPDQEPHDILAQVERHLEQHCPRGVNMKITPGHSGRPYLMDPHSPAAAAAQRALRRIWANDVALIREGGSIPIVETFKSVLGVDTLLLGLALPDCRIHSPNENFSLEIFEKGIRMNQALLEELAGWDQNQNA